MPEVISAPKYTDELLQLFREKGLALTMDEIAARLHLSKKTLYNIFTSKRGMVKAVMEAFFADVKRKMEKSRGAGDDAIGELLKSGAILQRELSRLRYPFIRDMLKYYKDLLTFSDPSGLCYQMLKNNLLYGMKCNLYRKVADADVVLSFFTSNLDSIYSSAKIDDYFNRLESIHSELMEFYLYSIVNDQSRILLESYLKK